MAISYVPPFLFVSPCEAKLTAPSRVICLTWSQQEETDETGAHSAAGHGHGITIASGLQSGAGS